jgi:lipid II:glycine glycyltransferase (peptidoglycan interpeptide bridge formation enzyme)
MASTPAATRPRSVATAGATRLDMMPIHEATDAELDDWDARAVGAPGGHVYQSRAWAQHRHRSGWQARHLVFDDGFAILVLTRSWPWIGGGSAYIPRGPISAGDAPDRTAERLGAVTRWLSDRRIDVVASDAEIPATADYGNRIRRLGFRPIPEIQPSRHRLTLPLAAGVDEAAVQAGFGKSTRQRIRGAERGNLRIARYDTNEQVTDEWILGPPARPLSEALHGFYSLLESTGERRGFKFGPRSEFVAWWALAHAHGHLVYLEANDGLSAVGGLILYRHGGRLSTVHSGDRSGARSDHPGVMHLLRWRAIQLAIREGSTEMDLGGVDIAPYHREPVEGMPMFGLYEHKRSFGATWVEMTGAHERVIHANRYRAGRVASKLARAIRR